MTHSTSTSTINESINNSITFSNHHQEINDQTSELELDSLSILSELASSVHPPAELSDETFHALLLASIPQSNDYSLESPHQLFETSNSSQNQFLDSLDEQQQQHAQDLLAALSVLQSATTTKTTTTTNSKEQIENSKQSDEIDSSDFLSSFNSQSDPFELLFRPPSLQSTSQEQQQQQQQQAEDDAARERVFESLFGLEPQLPSQPTQTFSPEDTDLLLATIDKRLAEDAELGKVDSETEIALDANVAYSDKIRKLLEEVGKALERGEELELLASHYLNILQQQALTSRQQTITNGQTDQINPSNSESIMMLFAEGSYAITLPWFKHKFGHDLPTHEDAVKRDRYNAILHQQAWQVGERRKLEEEVSTQLRSRLSRTTDSNNHNSPALDWTLISKALPDRSPIECRIQWNQKQHPNLNKSKWTPEEIDRLYEIAKRRNERDWSSIATELGTRRTAAECVKQYRIVTQERREWSESDDLLLREGVSMYGQNWQAVANHCGRSSNQCINRWSKTLRPDIKKGKWDAAEDEALKNAVAACGMVWKDVAPRVRGRTDAQCRERWCNILDPRIVVGNWTPEEDERIVSLRNVEGKTWSEISKSFNGRRTDNHCMRRYSELTKTNAKQRKLNSITTKLTNINHPSNTNTPKSSPLLPRQSILVSRSTISLPIPVPTITVPQKPPELQKRNSIPAELAQRINPDLLLATAYSPPIACSSSLGLELGKRARVDSNDADSIGKSASKKCK
ncbi:hypothetical protein CROQUDRAFT_130986 [Cronartium quercuum f. sp. fusiforme G11]|uniref:Uncharacterized protein n=1 Tax=Cronartium quercuum f. sp. fusiforme G11 TaxID=708437 RepID=A0A9P6TGR2_9BASI|nr:hypothetical protein CROQUDRAFT_130986 [Cronartium quercuum f. sp. fusiforme G11]